MSSIGAVVVLYKPEPDVVAFILALLKQSCVVVVVNDADDQIISQIEGLSGLTLIKNDINIGLGAALNLGIRHVFEEDESEYVVLFDQDSMVSDGFFSNICIAFESAVTSGFNPACIGPLLVDKKLPQAKVTQTRNNENSLKAVCSIATSGTLISRDAFNRCGPMREDFFIDALDHEWCFRARSFGYTVMLCDRVSLLHDMGVGAFSFFGKFKPVHTSPVRHYYITRNHVYLMRQKYASNAWRFREVFKIIRRSFFYIIISDSRVASFRLIFRGLRDGVAGKLGPL